MRTKRIRWPVPFTPAFVLLAGAGGCAAELDASSSDDSLGQAMADESGNAIMHELFSPGATGDVTNVGAAEMAYVSESGNVDSMLLADSGNVDPMLLGGSNWGADYYATSIAFGNVDGDSRHEVGITRYANGNARYWVLDDAYAGFAVLHSGGDYWGSGNYATSIAFGNVDNDSRDEVGIARRSDTNDRYFVLDDAFGGFVQLYGGGSEWGSGNYATSIAFGDVDGDGRDEVGITRHANENSRYYVLEDRMSNFNEIHSGGSEWGSGNYATSIAFGDVDGDGRDEVGIARRANENLRFLLLEDEMSGFAQIHSGGAGWGSGVYVTSIGFGDVDGDGRDEVGVARRSNESSRFYIYEDEMSDFGLIHSGGAGWGSGNYATAIAFGDMDGDGRDEVGIARNGAGSPRYYVLEDRAALFAMRVSDGSNWGSGYYATSIAFGSVDGDPAREIGIARHADVNMRYAVLNYDGCHIGPNGDVNYCSIDCPCGAGEGDCDSDNDCAADAMCVFNNGDVYGFPAGIDVCE